MDRCLPCGACVCSRLKVSEISNAHESRLTLEQVFTHIIPRSKVFPSFHALSLLPSLRQLQSHTSLVLLQPGLETHFPHPPFNTTSDAFLPGIDHLAFSTYLFLASEASRFRKLPLAPVSRLPSLPISAHSTSSLITIRDIVDGIWLAR